jgi:hypothetical protein
MDQDNMDVVFSRLYPWMDRSGSPTLGKLKEERVFHENLSAGVPDWHEPKGRGDF